MKLRQELEKAEKKHLRMLKYFMIAATVVAITGIITILLREYMVKEARYLLILAVTVACQGMWGFVLFDCMKRRLER